MTYAPAVGDTVRLIGDPRKREWRVERLNPNESLILTNPEWSMWVEPFQVERVEPPTPPGPPVGRVLYQGFGGRWYNIADDAVLLINPSDDDALRATGLCRVEDVADWLTGEKQALRTVVRFREMFGDGAK